GDATNGHALSLFAWVEAGKLHCSAQGSLIDYPSVDVVEKETSHAAPGKRFVAAVIMVMCISKPQGKRAAYRLHDEVREGHIVQGTIAANVQFNAASISVTDDAIRNGDIPDAGAVSAAGTNGGPACAEQAISNDDIFNRTLVGEILKANCIIETINRAVRN